MRLYEFRRGQNVEMKRKCRTRQVETASNGSRREAVRSVPDEQAEDIEARFLCQCRE